MSNEQQMYRQHKRMRVGTFLTLAVSRDRRSRRAATARPPQPSPQLQLQFSNPSALNQIGVLREPRTATGNKSILYCQIT